jgi:hypothetical protein
MPVGEGDGREKRTLGAAPGRRHFRRRRLGGVDNQAKSSRPEASQATQPQFT